MRFCMHLCVAKCAISLLHCSLFCNRPKVLLRMRRSSCPINSAKNSSWLHDIPIDIALLPRLRWRASKKDASAPVGSSNNITQGLVTQTPHLMVLSLYIFCMHLCVAYYALSLLLFIILQSSSSTAASKKSNKNSS